MTNRITSRTIKGVSHTIVRGVHPEKIVLFGSCARRAQSADSDLDLLVIMNSNLPRRQRTRMVYSLFNPYPCAMDILVYTPEEVARWKDTPASLVAQILSRGKVLYERTN